MCMCYYFPSIGMKVVYDMVEAVVCNSYPPITGFSKIKNR